MRRLPSCIAAAVAIGVLVAPMVATPASAHAYLARSSPADGAVLDRAPEMLALSFTERVELSATRVDIVDGDGRRWAVTSLALRQANTGTGGTEAQAGTADAAGTESPVDVVAGLPGLPPNTYHVAWRTLSSDDLHATTGTVVFGVQREVAAAAPAGPAAPGARESVLRGLGLLGLATLLGGAALVLVLTLLTRTGKSDPGALRRRLLRISAAGGGLALVATPAQLWVQVSAGGGNWHALLAQQAGSGRWLMREAGLAILAGSMLWGARTGRGLVVGLLGAAGATLAAVGTALLGHPMGGTLTTAVTGAVHVLAAGGWAGSVLVAAIALVPARGGADRAGQARLLLKAFAVLAVACLSTLVVTGLLLTGAQVATVDALLTTPYGLILLAKVAAVGVAGLLGLRTARHLRRSGRPVSRRGLLAEAVVLAGVLVLAGTLAAAGPARGPRFPVASRIATVPEVSGQVADLMDSITIRPNRPGRNVVTVTVADTRRPAPGPVTGVSVQLTSPDGTRVVHPVTRTADNWTVAVDEIRASGQWRVAVTVMRDGLSPVTDTHSWAVAQPQTGPVATVVSTSPLQPAIGTLAGLLAGAVSVAALVFGYRRRFPGGPARLSVWVASR